MRRFRGFLIAIAVLALSAGAAFAARLPQAAAEGLARASQGLDQAEHSSGQVVPPSGESSVSTDAQDQTDSTDQTGQTPGGDHGALVSEAAQGTTPAGWANHGAYVSAVARGTVKPGDPPPAGPAPTRGKSGQHAPTGNAPTK